MVGLIVFEFDTWNFPRINAPISNFNWIDKGKYLYDPVNNF